MDILRSILLLEDDESINRGVTFTLKKEGYLVFSCRTIAEAQKTFENHQIQLMICDITLPDGNGLEFVRKIRCQSFSQRNFPARNQHPHSFDIEADIS